MRELEIGNPLRNFTQDDIDRRNYTLVVVRIVDNKKPNNFGFERFLVSTSDETVAEHLADIYITQRSWEVIGTPGFYSGIRYWEVKNLFAENKFI